MKNKNHFKFISKIFFKLLLFFVLIPIIYLCLFTITLFFEPKYIVRSSDFSEYGYVFINLALLLLTSFFLSWKISFGTWLFVNKKFLGKNEPKVYKDQGVYFGELEKGKKHGMGELVYIYGENYTGKWENDERHGHGKHSFKDGSVYIGEWKNDKFNGFGKLTKLNGDILEGEWVDGEFVG